MRNSRVHGKGVFALTDIARGERIIEYKGELIPWDEALERHPHDPDDPNHTFFFDVDEGMVIDGGRGGNSARWINHSCGPNCVARQEEAGGRPHVYIHARRDIRAGEELFYDYGLTIDAKLTQKLRDAYKCLCGSRKCRGTLLAARRD